MSFNREAQRMVEGLGAPGQAPEYLLNTMTGRFPDGREFAIEERSLARELRVGRRVRAEEIELSVPDGRSINMLINTTPIRSDDGEVVSMFVAMQDLAPLEELERSRAEFLGLVSHELRAPLTSIKGSTTTVLMATPELDPAEQRAFFRIIDEQADHMRGLISDLLDAGRIETGTLSVRPESSEVAALVDRARNTFLSGGGRHTILVELPAGLPPVMADRRRIVQVLNNLFANAAQHSPESSPILVGAVRDGVHVAISIADEGRGVEPERLPELAGLPVIFISGYRREETIARVLDLGAADYIVKPFSPMELVARIRATLRRQAEPEQFEVGDLRIRYGPREVSVGGRPVELTATEFGLLRALSLNPGRVVTTNSLLRQVWGRRGGGDSERVRTYVKKLRRKLGDDAARPVYIFNKRGVGYRLAGPERH